MLYNEGLILTTIEILVSILATGYIWISYQIYRIQPKDGQRAEEIVVSIFWLPIIFCFFVALALTSGDVEA